MEHIQEKVLLSDQPEVPWVVGVGVGDGDEDPDGGGIGGSVRVITQ